MRKIVSDLFALNASVILSIYFLIRWAQKQNPKLAKCIILMYEWK